MSVGLFAVCVPIRPDIDLLLSAPDSVLSTQGVSGKPMKQGPASCITQHPSQVAFLPSMWPGVWALGGGSIFERGARQPESPGL